MVSLSEIYGSPHRTYLLTCRRIFAILSQLVHECNMDFTIFSTKFLDAWKRLICVGVWCARAPLVAAGILRFAQNDRKLRLFTHGGLHDARYPTVILNGAKRSEESPAWSHKSSGKMQGV